jgi:hypothetical protein
LHTCIECLPAPQHHIAMLAHCPDLSTGDTLHLVGEESAKGACTSVQGPRDTLARALQAAAACTHICCIHLGGMGMDAGRGTALAHLMAALPAVLELKLSECCLSAAAVEALRPVPAQSLTALEISDCSTNPSVATAAALGRLLAALPGLQRLELSDVALKGRALQGLMPALRRLRHLRHLRLDRIGMHAACVADLASALPALSCMEDLSVLGHRLTGKSAQVR